MSKQRTRRRRTRCAVARAIAVGGAVATLVAILGTGHAAAATAPPDERVLERQGRIDQQADEQGRAEESAKQPATELPRRFTKPEPDVSPGPWIDDQQTAPNPPPPEQAGPGLAVPAVLAALVLVAALSAWLLRHRHRPEPTT
jgi:hypothetical protein